METTQIREKGEEGGGGFSIEKPDDKPYRLIHLVSKHYQRFSMPLKNDMNS